MQDLQSHFGLVDFSGYLPLFPLPGVVLFPCSLLPLHIFEPRYRTMVGDASAKDGCIGMVMLRPGWESDYYGNPAIHDVACLGKMIESTRLEDGRFNIVLCGVKRARIEAIVSDKPYRTARVELLEDASTAAREREAGLLREKLLSVAQRIDPSAFRHKNVARALRKLDAPLGCSSDLLADSLLLPPPLKQELLEELNPIARAERLVHAIDAEFGCALGAPALRRFPPAPSIN